MTLAGFDLAKSIVGLIGNLLSATGAGFITICYIFLLPISSHFRHKLILNLAIADWLNGTIGSYNQISTLALSHPYNPGSTACTLVGFIVQLSVQAIDTSILALALTTVLAVTKPHIFDHLTPFHSILILSSTWAFPLITASIAAGKEWYKPASGGWCWIQAKPVWQRYVLTHAWRFAEIVGIAGLFAYLWWYLRRNVGEWEMAEGERRAGGWVRGWTSRRSREDVVGGDAEAGKAVAMERVGEMEVDGGTDQTSEEIDRWQREQAEETKKRMDKIRRALLMRAYPTAFVVLWIPGLANRLVEATGKVSPGWLVLLQSSTSYIGFVNAITYGWNEGIAIDMRRRWRSYKEGSLRQL